MVINLSMSFDGADLPPRDNTASGFPITATPKGPGRADS